MYEYEYKNKKKHLNFFLVVVFLEMAESKQNTFLELIRTYKIDDFQSVCHMSFDKTGKLYLGDGMGKIGFIDCKDSYQQLEIDIPNDCKCHHTARNGELYYTYRNGGTHGIKKRAKNGEITNFNIQKDDKHLTKWEPISIYASRITDDILIGMTAKKGKMGRVIRCDSTGNIKRDIVNESVYPHYITETSNESICVSDSGKKAVMIERECINPDPKDADFNPKGICIDSNDNIIVCVAHKLHFLKSSGGSLYDVSIDEEGKNASVCVCVGNGGYLHVGYNDSKTVKVYKYQK